MPYILEDLIVNRVDLVYEGANTGAFIEIFKRKEKQENMNFSEIVAKLKPEHAEVLKQHNDNLTHELDEVRKSLDEANGKVAELDEVRKSLDEANSKIEELNATVENTESELAKAREELDIAKADSKYCTCDGAVNEDNVCGTCGKPKKSASFDETEVLKTLPEGLRDEFLKMRAQKDAAEEQVRKAAEEKLEAEAVAKANTLKALPVEQAILVDVLKSCSPAVLDILTSAAAAIEGTVLSEVGKSKQGNIDTDAWSKIESEAKKIAERDSVTMQKAISVVIKEKPELYKEYLNGGNE